MTLRRRATLATITVVVIGVIIFATAMLLLVRNTFDAVATEHAEDHLHDIMEMITAEAEGRERAIDAALDLLVDGQSDLSSRVTDTTEQALLDLVNATGVGVVADGTLDVIAGDIPPSVRDHATDQGPAPRLVAADDHLVVMHRRPAAAPEVPELVVIRELADDLAVALGHGDEPATAIRPIGSGSATLPPPVGAPTVDRRADAAPVATAPVLNADGDPIAELTTELETAIGPAARQLLTRVTVALLAVGVAAALMMIGAFDRLVLRRIEHLTDLVDRSREANRPPVKLDGHDEVARLSERVEETLQRFEASESDLQRLGEELRASNAEKDRFLSFVSHEFRTPLTALRGWAETLLHHSDRIDEARRQDIAQRLVRQVGILDEMVDDLLMLAQAERGELPTRPDRVRLLEVVSEVLEDLAPRVEIPVGLDVPADIELKVDRRHLYRMLANYLTNAAKYGAPPFELRTRPRAGRVRIELADAGTGVPESFVPHLFDDFRQAGAGGRYEEGVGLGLAIVRELARANDGAAGYERGDPRGSVFWIELPAANGA